MLSLAKHWVNCPWDTESRGRTLLVQEPGLGQGLGRVGSPGGRHLETVRPKIGLEAQVNCRSERTHEGHGVAGSGPLLDCSVTVKMPRCLQTG